MCFPFFSLQNPTLCRAEKATFVSLHAPNRPLPNRSIPCRRMSRAGHKPPHNVAAGAAGAREAKSCVVLCAPQLLFLFSSGGIIWPKPQRPAVGFLVHWPPNSFDIFLMAGNTKVIWGGRHASDLLTSGRSSQLRPSGAQRVGHDDRGINHVIQAASILFVLLSGEQRGKNWKLFRDRQVNGSPGLLISLCRIIFKSPSFFCLGGS